MKTFLVIVLVLTGLLFILSVMLMSPKGGIGFGIGGASGSNEYGSKKSIENTLKKIAITTSIIFVILVMILPYID